jgi:transcriptional regulator with XRE-family HTH domain
MDRIFERILVVRKKFDENQKEFAARLNIPLRSLQNYESGKTENIPHSFLKKLVDLGFDANWLISGIGKAERNINSITDDLIVPKFELLKASCTPSEFDSISQDVLEGMLEIVDKKIAELLVSDILKKQKEAPLFDKIKDLLIMNEIGATVRIWNIIEIASRDESPVPAKAKFIDAVKNGRFMVPQSRRERELLEKAVDGWSDEVCEYLLENSQKFTNTLKKFSGKIENAIESNQKILDFVRKIKNYLDR